MSLGGEQHSPACRSLSVDVADRHDLTVPPPTNGGGHDRLDLDDGPSSSSPSSPSSSSTSNETASDDLTLLSGAVLLTADCMGTGILALPADVASLGLGWGLAFLLLNLPANLYAGTMLARCATFVERRGRNCDACRPMPMPMPMMPKEDDGNEGDGENNTDVVDGGKAGMAGDRAGKKGGRGRGMGRRSNGRKGYSSVVNAQHRAGEETSSSLGEEEEGGESKALGAGFEADAATFDFVGVASALFDHGPPGGVLLPSADDAFVADPDDGVAQRNDDAEDSDRADNDRNHRPRRMASHDGHRPHTFTKVVLAVYYVNLFLVLGNYILVMSHAVSAMAGEDNMCIPAAGVIASTLMFALSQLRTMARLGRGVSVMSLLALLIVVVQCLRSLRGTGGGEDDYNNNNNEIMEEELQERASYTPADVSFAKMGSLASIGFAVGSQKLLLNIRHEMADRSEAAPGALSLALLAYGVAYVAVCLLAGPDPPSFLFDAIPPGTGRRVGGFLLWVHVAVSYAINSQALCSSLDRMAGGRGVEIFGLGRRHGVRWGIITALVALSSYSVANAIPFFKDLVALCGAATSIPLTLLFPAIFYRRAQGVPICFPTLHTKYSFALVVFSILFMVMGLIGAIGSIDVDWSNKSGPFACH